MSRIWHAAWLLSLALAIVVASGWLACRWWTFALVHDPVGWLQAAALVEDGHVYVFWFDSPPPSLIRSPIDTGVTPNPRGEWWGEPAVAAGRSWIDFAGVHLVQPLRFTGGPYWIVCPLIYPLLLALVLPLMHVWRWWNRGRRRRNRVCTRCGYDLRATRGACPECGEAAPAAWRESPPRAWRIDWRSLASQGGVVA